MARVVSLPKTYRPFAARIVAVVASGSLIAVIAVAWIALPGHLKAQFDWFQRVTLLAVFGAGLSVLWGIARCRVVARDDGVTIVNMVTKRRYDWAELVEISLRGSAPWATVDLADGTTSNVMAIQGVDGDRALTSVRELAGVIAAKSRTNRND
jgi:Bacterial PH domain